VSEGREVPDGSEEVGRRVRLPGGAERPIQVFVNGLERVEGTDYEIHGREIVFAKPIVKERVSRGRWLAMALGLFGSYGKNETVDVHYRIGESTRVADDVDILPD
jgi:hypothetical protein